MARKQSEAAATLIHEVIQFPAPEKLPAPEPEPLPAPMDDREKARLMELEGVIRANIEGFFKVCQAMKEIHDNRLYRDRHETFEAYCGSVWDMGKSNAYYKIEACAAIERLTALDVPLPANERQIRPLTRLAPEDQADAWQKAVKTAPYGRITGAHVAKVVRGVKGEKMKKKTAELKQQVNVIDQVSKGFKSAYMALMDQLTYDRQQHWAHTDPKAVCAILSSLIKNLQE